jgi:hypothetical protein
MTISQPLNNVPLVQQTGGGFVAKATADFDGGDALIGFSASAWTQGAGPISMELWLDGEPTGGELALFANRGGSHTALGHLWAWGHDLSPGQHEIALLAGDTTITDQNDYACVTVWNMSDGGVVLFNDDAQCPVGSGQELLRARFGLQIDHGVALVSASASGWATTPASLVSGELTFDGDPVDPTDPIALQIFANSDAMHLPMVATDFVFAPVSRGQHMVQFLSDGGTATNSSDIAHLTVVEFLGQGAPAVLGQFQNLVTDTQDGSGGDTIAQMPFTSSGGPLLVRTALSAWTQQVGPLSVGIQVDGTSMGFAQIFANVTNMHMASVVNDLVVTGIAAGDHTLNLMAEANTITDQNDRVSVLILEFPQ